VDTMGKTAFYAYMEAVDGKNHRGEAMPEWHELPASIRTAWEAAAYAVLVAR
jgi:hypothetical protein